jgi:hypothetical protein
MIVLTVLVVVFVAVAAVVASIHQSPSRPTPPAAGRSGTHATTQATIPVDRAGVAQVESATAAADRATTAARTKLHALTGFPTPTTVAAVINPYVRSLRRYRTVLASATTLPVSAQGAAAIVGALVTRDVKDLNTINGLPSIDLGTYLDAFGLNAGQLQEAFGTLRIRLGALHN